MDANLLWQGATALATLGAAFGGVRVALNGTRQDIKDIREDVRTHIAEDKEVQVQLLTSCARIETKLEERTRNVG